MAACAEKVALPLHEPAFPVAMCVALRCVCVCVCVCVYVCVCMCARARACISQNGFMACHPACNTHYALRMFELRVTWRWS